MSTRFELVRWIGSPRVGAASSGRAVIWAAARNPQVNATWTDTEIIIKRYMNLGIAAATPRGLLVPNIKDAQDLSLRELAIALHELTQTARAGRTQPGDMQGGTLSITNIGALGIDTVAVVRRPVVRIVPVGREIGDAGDLDSPMLAALVERDGGIADRRPAGPGGADALHGLLARPGADLILVAGGSGLGETDRSAEALAAAVPRAETVREGVALVLASTDFNRR